ncbi:MAG: hypothetical protein JOZ09_04090 [Pseudonocardiales bacterium]|nr:hypothetical protein [Pseudonocardiales bacterium]
MIRSVVEYLGPGQMIAGIALNQPPLRLAMPGHCIRLSVHSRLRGAAPARTTAGLAHPPNGPAGSACTGQSQGSGLVGIDQGIGPGV